MNLMQHPTGKRDTELFVDMISKMMPGLAQFVPAAVAAVLDCGRTDPPLETQERVVSALSPFKLGLLEVRGDAVVSPRRRMADDVGDENHAELIAGMRKDRRRLPRLQQVLVSPPPVLVLPEACSLASLFEQRIPAMQEAAQNRAAELQRIQSEEQQASTRLMSELTTLDEKLTSLQARERQLRQELEEVQKQIAESISSRRDLAKEADHELSGISMRKRIADTEISERSKLVELLRVATNSWDKFMQNGHAEFVRNSEETFEEVQNWLRTRLDRILACLHMHRDRLERAAAELATRGKSLLASEAWKVAQEEATQFLSEASQFLAAFPATLHEMHASILDEIVMLREEVQRICDGGAGGGVGGSGGVSAAAAQGLLPSVGSRSSIALPQPQQLQQQQQEEEKFVLPSQRLLTSPPVTPSMQRANTGAFVLPSDRLLGK